MLIPCAAFALVTAGWVPTTTAGVADLQLTPIVGGLARPVGVVAPADGSGRLFVVEQTGRIRVVEGNTLLAPPFLDLSSEVSCCGERGLLGLALHPGFPANRAFFVDYTDAAGDTVVARYLVSTGDPDAADPLSGSTVISQNQPYTNHNGGEIAFGRDGFLYIGLGDGGSSGDPDGNGQDSGTLLGTILRLDVDSASPYAVPADNPFVGVVGARPEIWAWGLRNPWRFTFDRFTGDLFIADVGQGSWEEINLEPAGGSGGRNYGWNRMEGTHCYSPPGGCEDPSLVLPILEYGHTAGRCSVTGGFRYRGARIPWLQGSYIYGDYCTGEIWAASSDGDAWISTPILDAPFPISSFGEDADGEVLVVAYDASDGAVYRLADPTGIFGDRFESGGLSAWSGSAP